MGKYTGKKVVVTGGMHSMGLAIVKALLEGGVEVLLTGRNEQNLEAARRKFGARAHVVRSDTASMADINALGALVKEKLGQVDFVFINAGVSGLAPFDQVTEASYDRQFDVNTKGAFFTVQRLTPLVQEGGSIVFTTVANGPASANLSVYSGSKAALRAFAQVFAAELVSRGVRDRTGLARPGNAFANTGPAITPFTYHAPPSALDDLKRRLAQTRWPERETVADWSQGVPLKKMKALVEYWRTDYDWRRCEARLNGLGQYRMPFVFPDPIPTAGLSAAEQRAVDAFKRFQTDGFGYFLQQC